MFSMKGRPPLPYNVRRSGWMKIRVSPNEAAMLAKLSSPHVGLSTFVRDLALSAATRMASTQKRRRRKAKA